jgi:hypothetical protein
MVSGPIETAPVVVLHYWLPSQTSSVLLFLFPMLSLSTIVLSVGFIIVAGISRYSFKQSISVGVVDIFLATELSAYVHILMVTGYLQGWFCFRKQFLSLSQNLHIIFWYLIENRSFAVCEICNVGPAIESCWSGPTKRIFLFAMGQALQLVAAQCEEVFTPSYVDLPPSSPFMRPFV